MPRALGPHCAPGVNENIQTLLGMDAAKKQRRAGLIRRAGMPGRGRGDIDPIGQYHDPGQQAKICYRLGLAVGGGVQGGGPVEVAFLIGEPGELLFHPLVCQGPGLQHAANTDNTRQIIMGREPCQRMIVRQPNAVVVHNIGLKRADNLLQVSRQRQQSFFFFYQCGGHSRPVRRP